MQESSAPAAFRNHAEAARPFAILFLIGVLSLVAPVGQLRSRDLVLAMLGVLVLAVAQWYLSNGSRPRWLVLLPAFASFVVVALLRDASGGSSSGLSVLAVVPAFYLALVGTRRDLRIAVVLTGVTFLAPLLLIGEPRYTVEEWRRAAVYMAIVFLIGSIVQRLVLRLSDEIIQARRSEARLQMVMDGAELSAMIVTDVHGAITTFGVGAEHLLGARAAEVVGQRDLTDLHDPVEIQEAADELGVDPGFGVFAALAAARADSRIWTWRCPNGNPILVRQVITQLWDEGQLVGYLSVATDVSEAIRSQTALLHAEQRWRVVMDNLPDTTLIVADEQHEVTLISGAGSMREMLKHAPGQPLSTVVSPDNVEVLTNLTNRALDGVSGALDLNSARTGHEHDVSVVPLIYSDGSTNALILARDVSRERARERALERAKHRAERMFVDAPGPVLLHDLDGMILSANPAAERLFEAAPGLLVGRGAFELVDEERGTALIEYLDRIRTSGAEITKGRWQLRLPDGRERFLSLTSRVLHDDPDHPELVLTFVVDRTDQHLHEEQLTHLADHDPLTGLANRRRFGAELERHLETCRRYGAEGALLMLDLDRFKQVNDTLGHPVGDQVLIAVADLLSQDLRASDTVARLGGDEFAVLLPRISRDDVEVVASSLVRSLRRAMQRHEGPAREVTMSVGVTMVEDCELTGEQLMALGDVTLYAAKQRGRDQHVVYNPPRMDAPAV